MDRTKEAAVHFKKLTTDVRSRCLPDNGQPWYPYDILGNIWHLSSAIAEERQSLFENLTGKAVADSGADGDLGLFLASRGASVDIIDNPPTNMNGLSGAETLSRELGLQVGIHRINLDDQFHLPRKYDFALFLGILYHLKNPFYALEKLASNVRHMVLSTRISEFTAPVGNPRRARLEGTSAYLLDSSESNNDDTNYWTFNEASLRLILRRTGWKVLDFHIMGSPLESSDPQSAEGDSRAFCYVESGRI